MNNKITVILIVVYATLITMPIRAEENAISLDELLQRVEQGHIKDMEENKAREEKFQATKDRQSALLADVIKLRKEEENKSKQLEISFDENEQTIGESQQELTLRLGDLKELFRYDGSSHFGKQRPWAYGTAELEKWLLSLPKPIVLMTPSDPRGVRVIQLCHKLGLAIPDDIAIISSNNDLNTCEFAQKIGIDLDDG